jgi:3-hydroxymyristoyl/3-hydroxydecanoyl-(acyl carrier protein) dehydratase
VTDAAVLAVDVASSRGHELWAVVAGREISEGALSVPRLREHLLRSLEAVAVPRRFRLVEALPREATGKVPKERLRALFLTGGSGASQSAAATAEVVVNTFSFPASSPYFRGHFDDFPLLPGVVQLNDLALRTVRGRWPHLPRLTRVMGLKFKSPIRPGDDVTLEARLMAPAKVAFTLRRGEELISQGTLLFAPREDV